MNIEQNEISFEETYYRTVQFIYSIAYRLTGQEENARDLVQETYIKAWSKWDQCQHKDKPLPWLRRICINTFIDQKRREIDITSLEGLEEEGKTVEFVSDLPSPEEEIEADEMIKQVKEYCFTAITTKLPLYQRIAFVLVDIFNLNIEEVANLLNRSVYATKALLHRSRENINAFFGNRCSLIAPTNICKCKAWLSFMGHAAELKERARPEFAQEPNFTDPQYKNQSRPETMQRVIFFFKNLPFLKPQEDWLNEVATLLRKRYNLNRILKQNHSSIFLRR
ncbi:MAG: RNA polymerase sigma factor [bacterium]